jgi:hypothetical protein
MLKTSTLSLISVSGAVLLFASWAFQQTLLDQANGEMQAISNAQSVYQTYQSNNALFNAVGETLGGDARAQQRVRQFQIYSYELGLRPMQSLLDPEQRQDLPGPVNVYSGDFEFERAFAITQDRLEKIQARLFEKKDRIQDRKTRLKWMFLTLYGLGSLAVLIANSVKALRPERA